jgi:hypothetical protein
MFHQPLPVLAINHCISLPPRVPIELTKQLGQSNAHQASHVMAVQVILCNGLYLQWQSATITNISNTIQHKPP